MPSQSHLVKMRQGSSCLKKTSLVRWCTWIQIWLLATRETPEFFGFITENNKECLRTSRIQKHVKNRREVPEKYTRNRKSKHCDAVTEDSKGTNQAWRCTCLCFRTILKCDELCSSVIQAVICEIAEVNKKNDYTLLSILSIFSVSWFLRCLFPRNEISQNVSVESLWNFAWWYANVLSTSCQRHFLKNKRVLSLFA